MRTIFFGTPEIAVPALRALAETTDLLAVVCQPDRPAGRGLELTEPPVKTAALELDLPVHQPARVRDGALQKWMEGYSPDVAVVMAYGRILPAGVLAVPRSGCINLHASLLPSLRGAAPIQWALIRGARETGISLMQMDTGMDTGPVFIERRVAIGPEEDAGSLARRLAELAADVVREELPRAVSGEVQAVPQDDTLATEAPPLVRDDARLDWSRPSHEIVNRVRGLSPRPGAFTTREGKTFKVLAARTGPGSPGNEPPGTVVRADQGGLWITSGTTVIEVLRGQVEGKRAAPFADLVNGRVLRLGDRLGS